MCRFALRATAPVLLALALAGPAAVLAQDVSPPAGETVLAAMGYPELPILVTEDTYELPTTSVAAGRTVITLENAGRESLPGVLLRLPDAVSDEQAPADIGACQEPPPWLLESTLPGFPGETQPGQTNAAVVDLAPGRYLIARDVVQRFDVVGDAATPATAGDPAADGAVRLVEYGFDLPDAPALGRHVWAVTNAGREPHELLLARSPAPITRDQVTELVMMGESQDATPTGGGPSAREILAVGGMGWLSPDQTAWTELDLEPGTYVVACSVFDTATGLLHIQMGMVDVVTVNPAGGTPHA